MTSYGLRRVKKINIDKRIEITRTENSKNVIGTIEPANETQLIDNIDFDIYKCEFYKDKTMDIIVDGTPYSEFKEINSFKIYHSNDSKLLIAKEGLLICTPFLKYLAKSNPDLVEYSSIDFDFVKIVRNRALVDQVWFGTTDQHARTKGFNGTRVNKNKEAMAAISDGKATYIKVQIDVASNGKNLKRTVGFSKKSGIVIIKKNDPTIDNVSKELQLLMDTYKTYGDFK
ncbi:hypothetical protein [Enterococcus hirae]|uniref:hypothetical protein n=1 Tax=Enterococcus hirae TaxID=1354 RepID=UPI0019D91C47|nr:hypothetical protein [Enterococcus hirae]